VGIQFLSSTKSTTGILQPSTGHDGLRCRYPTINAGDYVIT